MDHNMPMECSVITDHAYQHACVVEHRTNDALMLSGLSLALSLIAILLMATRLKLPRDKP